MEPHTLASDQLTVLLDSPGSRYQGPRFDWTTQVRQVTFAGRTLLTREKEAEPSPADQGWGLAGEFGIETPLGFTDCPTGSSFPKIGVGRLVRPDDRPFRFNRAYAVSPARFGVKSEGPAALVVTADQTPDRGYGWFLKRHWSVRGAELTLATTLANTGSLPLATEEYIHNFFGGDDAVGPGWALDLPRPWEPRSLAKLVDDEALLAFEGPRLTWTKTPTRDFFLSDRRSPGPSTWTLVHRGSGVSVTETVDFPVSQFNLWGRGHVVSPELYRNVEVAPGASLAWTRRWTFQSLPPQLSGGPR